MAIKNQVLDMTPVGMKFTVLQSALTQTENLLIYIGIFCPGVI